MKEYAVLFAVMIAAWAILLIGAVVAKLRDKDRMSTVLRIFSTAILAGTLTAITRACKIEIGGDRMIGFIVCCLAAVLFNHTTIYVADQLRYRCPSCGGRELLKTRDNLDLRIKQCAKCKCTK